jgi:hypothetical protein
MEAYERAQVEAALAASLQPTAPPSNQQRAMDDATQQRLRQWAWLQQQQQEQQGQRR